MIIICGLARNKVGGKEIPPAFVAIKVQEVFMLKTMIPNVDETPRPMDPQCSHMKISPRAMISWSFEFLKLACDAHGNHVVAL